MSIYHYACIYKICLGELCASTLTLNYHIVALRRTSIVVANRYICIDLNDLFKFYLYCIFHIKVLKDLLFVSYQVTQYCLIPTYPTQHYLVLIRFQSKISLKSTINMYLSFHIVNSKI